VLGTLDRRPGYAHGLQLPRLFCCSCSSALLARCSKHTRVWLPGNEGGLRIFIAWPGGASGEGLGHLLASPAPAEREMQHGGPTTVPARPPATTSVAGAIPLLPHQATTATRSSTSAVPTMVDLGHEQLPRRWRWRRACCHSRARLEGEPEREPEPEPEPKHAAHMERSGRRRSSSCGVSSRASSTSLPHRAQMRSELVAVAAATKTEETSPASGARDRGRTSRLTPGAWQRVAAVVAARATRASLDAAERAIVAEVFGTSPCLSAERAIVA
jgi:hypothetical protein